MKRYKIIASLLFAIIIAFSAFSCSPTGTSQVTIRINLGLPNQNAFNTQQESLIDRIFRFFAKNAEAQAAPLNLTSLILNITSSDMDAIQQTYTAGNIPPSITLEVPAGSSRLFEVLASTPSVTFRGTATRDLAGGETVDIPISMELYETKLVIPDPFANFRLVQIDDIGGTASWIERTGAEFLSSGLISTNASYFQPWDVDFDAQGRIYIANNHFTDDVIIRIDDMNLASLSNGNQAIITNASHVGAVRGLVINRSTDNVYFISSNELFRQSLTNISDYVDMNISTDISTTGYEEFIGITLDANGYLYIADRQGGPSMGGMTRIIKFDLINGTSPNRDIATYSSTVDSNEIYDVLFKSDYIYVATVDNTQGDKIFRLDIQNLLYVDEMPSAGHPLYGPRRFVATLNRRIYFADEENNADKLVAMDNINGDNWQIYGTKGPGIGEFKFFMC